MKPALFISIALGTVSASATLNTDQPRGNQTVNFQVPGRQRPEICVIPKHLPNADYTKKDAKHEAKLCALDFYKTAPICPKLNGTNPGVDVHSIPKGYTFQQVENAKCEIPDPKQDPKSKKKKDLAKKVAKYKLSTSCSYTPSILSYYHVSRALGNILNVPRSVLRTLDLRNHIALGNQALHEVPAGDVIGQTWASLMHQLTLGLSAPRKDALLTSVGDQSYGALVEVPKKDMSYREFFNGGANNEERTQRLATVNPIIADLARSGPLGIPLDFTAANVQKVIQLRDAANMIVMDTLLSQEDRMGNIAYLEKYFYLDQKANQTVLKEVKAADAKEEGLDLSKAVLVKEMLLKDNDCGVSRSNLMSRYGLPNKIAHIDPAVYYRLLQLNGAADKPEMKAFFANELIFTASDFIKFRQNLASLSQQLHDACVAKGLTLDLNLQDYFTGHAAPTSCEAPAEGSASHS